MNLFLLFKGIAYIIYGLLKCTFCICDLLPKDLIKFKFLTHDTSQAGLLLIFIFLAFSIYTLIHGFAVLNLAPNNIIEFFSYKFRSVITFYIFGLILITVFSLVNFTNIKITKSENKEDKSSYKILGFGGGFLFWAAALIVFIIKRDFDFLSAISLIIILLLIMIFIIIVKSTIDKKDDDDKMTLFYKVFSAGIVPLTAF
jgi:uncharacterized membrane protein